MKAVGIVTLDYEDYGRALDKVNPIRNVIDPTYRIADFFETYQIPLTLFVNVTEVMAYERYDLPAAQAYTSQLCDLHKRGHDIQLHFHPQWLDYSRKGDQWLNESPIPYATQPLDHSQWYDALVSCRDWLTEITKKAPIAYRAGGYCIEPLNINMQVLSQVGIKCDSSLHGRDAQPYKIGDILEVPIYGDSQGRWDMSGRTKDASYLKKPQDNCVYVMQGHNKQTVHYDILHQSILTYENIEWRTITNFIGTYQ